MSTVFISLLSIMTSCTSKLDIFDGSVHWSSLIEMGRVVGGEFGGVGLGRVAEGRKGDIEISAVIFFR